MGIDTKSELTRENFKWTTKTNRFQISRPRVFNTLSWDLQL
jgi:hypothetical protein